MNLFVLLILLFNSGGNHATLYEPPIITSADTADFKNFLALFTESGTEIPKPYVAKYLGFDTTYSTDYETWNYSISYRTERMFSLPISDAQFFIVSENTGVSTTEYLISLTPDGQYINGLMISNSADTDGPGEYTNLEYEMDSDSLILMETTWELVDSSYINKYGYTESREFDRTIATIITKYLFVKNGELVEIK